MELARAVGVDVPIYTVTGWQGCVPQATSRQPHAHARPTHNFTPARPSMKTTKAKDSHPSPFVTH
jgi:hypothetical protein